jgi:transcriptional regulator with XRE-family HTH domain
MQKVLNSDSIKATLLEKGWDQKRLACEIGVSAQAVTNWFKGKDFPRPDKLLKLSTSLSLSFAKLVQPDAAAPIVAFRKKAGSKTTDDHTLQAQMKGSLLRPLVPYLKPLQALRTLIPAPSTIYIELQNTVASVRQRLGVGQQAVLTYGHLIRDFAENDAVIIPVMWGKKNVHENAIHILLRQERVTFIYLNLDTHIEDFKFWMAHELAHEFTPDMAGSNQGEDFADAFAGALLFPMELAQKAYSHAIAHTLPSQQLNVLQQFASAHSISLNSVYKEVSNYARASGLSVLQLIEKQIHVARTVNRGELVSETLFQPRPPEPGTYIAAARNLFETQFFEALQRMLREHGTGIGYLQQIMDLSIADATALHRELLR